LFSSQKPHLCPTWGSQNTPYCPLIETFQHHPLQPQTYPRKTRPVLFGFNGRVKPLDRTIIIVGYSILISICLYNIFIVSDLLVGTNAPR